MFMANHHAVCPKSAVHSALWEALDARVCWQGNQRVAGCVTALCAAVLQVGQGGRRAERGCSQ